MSDVRHQTPVIRDLTSEIYPGVPMQGVVKVYDPKTGIGVVVSDVDRSEIVLRPGSLRGSIFRTLRQGQRIVFDVETDGDRDYATSVRIGSDGY